MNEQIYSVYDLIEVLRLRNGMSGRKLAKLAEVSSATLASLITRQPSTIGIDTLDKIAQVFGVKWYELLNRPSSIVEDCILDSRVSVVMTKEDIMAVGERLMSGFDFMPSIDKIHNLEKRERKVLGIEKEAVISPEVATPGKDEFRSVIFFVLDRLNHDGLLEAMRRILDVANDPKYCK